MSNTFFEKQITYPLHELYQFITKVEQNNYRNMNFVTRYLNVL